MVSRDVIEKIVLQELKSLCINCLNRNTCFYRASTDKVIIQCELHVADMAVENDNEVIGLCKSCTSYNSCSLFGRKSGVWHCDEFK